MSPFSPRALRSVLGALLLLCAPTAAHAQHGLLPQGGGSYDPRVPTPRQVLGYELGERFTPHHLIARYVERLAAASPRVRVDTLGHTFEGREILLATVTGEAHQRRLGDVRQDAQRLAFPHTMAGSELAAVVARTPSIAWMGYSVHGNEASGVEAALGLLYQLAAGQDAETRRILDSVVVLVDPVQNPDGHERHVQDVMRRRGALGVPTSPYAMIHAANWPGARTSHYGFDLNRDWFLLSHPETQARVGTFRTWYPHVGTDVHEMGSNSTYFFAPPMAPLNKNVPASIIRWWDVYAAANAAAFDRQGWPYFRREGYDEFYPGYGVSWPVLTGAVGMTFEQASSAGGAVRRSDNTVLTLKDAAMHHYAASWATLLTTATRRTDRVRDYAEFRRSAVEEGARAAGGIRSVVFARDAQGRADTLARRLLQNGIAVSRTRDDVSLAAAIAFGTSAAGAVRVPAGAYVVDLAQPQGRLARAILEPDAQLDSTFIREELESRRTGQDDRFYDLTAWAMPFTYRVRAWTTAAAVAGAESVSLAALEGSRPAAPPRAAHGYAFAPGSEGALRMLAGLLQDSVRVWYAPKSFRSGATRFPLGAFVVRAQGNDARVHDLVARHASAARLDVAPISSALVDEGTDLGSNSVVPVRAPRIALLGGAPVNGNSFGFAWFALDQRMAYPHTAIDVNAVADGALREFDVLVIPESGSLDRALGEGGLSRLQNWVRDGGVLVTLGSATGWLANERVGLSRLRARRDSAGPAGEGAPLPASVPGAIVRVTADTLSPLLAGIRDIEMPVLVQGERSFATPRDLRPGEVVLRHAPLARLRLAGYLWPEAPARLAGTPYLWTERVGRGRVIAFAGDPNFRDMWRGLLPIFGNAVLLGGSF